MSMAMSKPSRAPSVDTEAAQAFIKGAAAIDVPSGQRQKRQRQASDDRLARITLLLPIAMLKEIDQAVVGTATPRLVWIRQAVENMLKVERAEKAKAQVPEVCAMMRQRI